MSAIWVGFLCLAVALIAGLPADVARRKARHHEPIAQAANVLAMIGTIAGLAATGDIRGWRTVAVIVGIVVGQLGADQLATRRWGRRLETSS